MADLHAIAGERERARAEEEEAAAPARNSIVEEAARRARVGKPKGEGK